MGEGQPEAGVVDSQHGSMSLRRGGRPDRIGSLFDGACPTAATPDTGRTERLPAAVTVRRSRYRHGRGPTGSWRCRQPARVDVPAQGRAPGPDRLAVRRCLPDGRNAGYREDRTLTGCPGAGGPNGVAFGSHSSADRGHGACRVSGWPKRAPPRSPTVRLARGSGDPTAVVRQSRAPTFRKACGRVEAAQRGRAFATR